MPSTVDLDNLEQNINGEFLRFLAAGGVDVQNLEALTKVKHNTFDRALCHVGDTLFRADKRSWCNKQSLLPYDDVEILKRIINIYYRLCSSTDNDCTLLGLSNLTAFEYSTIKMWCTDELNPQRLDLLKGLQKKRQDMIENKLSDQTIGTVALANNSKSLGLEWARSSGGQIAKSTVFILPGEQARQAVSGGNLAQIGKNP